MPKSADQVTDVEFPMPGVESVTPIPLDKDGHVIILEPKASERFSAEDVIEATTPLPLDKNGQVIVTDVEFPMPDQTPSVGDDRDVAPPKAAKGK